MSLLLLSTEKWKKKKTPTPMNMIFFFSSHHIINAKHQFYHEKVMRAGFKARGSKK